MDTIQLKNILSQNIHNVHPYVCAIDQLETIFSNNFCIIVNSDVSTKRGTHWFALFKTAKEKYIDFFDSFALPVNSYGELLTNFLRRNGNNIRFNKTQCQPNQSVTCGMFCVYFVCQRDRGVRFRTILSNFSTNLQKNNLLVTTFVKTLQTNNSVKVCKCQECETFRKFKIRFIQSCKKCCTPSSY